MHVCMCMCMWPWVSMYCVWIVIHACVCVCVCLCVQYMTSYLLCFREFPSKFIILNDIEVSLFFISMKQRSTFSNLESNSWTVREQLSIVQFNSSLTSYWRAPLSKLCITSGKSSPPQYIYHVWTAYQFFSHQKQMALKLSPFHNLQ